MSLLLQKGADVHYNDPFIPVLPAMRHYPHLRMASQELTAEYLGIARLRVDRDGPFEL